MCLVLSLSTSAPTGFGTNWLAVLSWNVDLMDSGRTNLPRVKVRNISLSVYAEVWRYHWFGLEGGSFSCIINLCVFLSFNSVRSWWWLWIIGRFTFRWRWLTYFCVSGFFCVGFLREKSRFTNCACVCLQVLLLLLSLSAVLVGALSLTALCCLFPWPYSHLQDAISQLHFERHVVFLTFPK